MRVHDSTQVYRRRRSWAPMADSLRRRSLRHVSQRQTIVVLGGGVAGIAAACRLAERGHAPLLLESRPYLGGRVRSFVHESTGDEIDNGQHLMMGCYHHTLRLLSILGTRDLVSILRPLDIEFRDADGTTDRLRSPSHLPSPVALVAGVARLNWTTPSDVMSVIRLGLAARLRAPHEDTTVRDWLTTHGQSQRLLERLWEPMTIATLNTPIDQASARLFAQVLRRGFLAWGDDARLAIPRAGLSRLLAPAQSYIERNGGVVRTGATVRSVRRGTGAYAIALSSGDLIESDAIIAAVPRASLRSVLDPTLQSGIGLEAPDVAAPIVSLYLWYDHNPYDLPMLCGMIGTRIQWVFNRRKIERSGETERKNGLISCTISAAFAEAATEASEIVATADAELRRAIPSLASAHLLESLVLKERHATFLATPTHERQRPGPTTRIPGLVLAGDWTDTSLPATIEGAVQSGVVAANNLLGTWDRS